MKNDNRCSLDALWWVPALIPLLIIPVSFLMGGWYWGLMDDLRALALSGSVMERTVALIRELISLGRFYPVYCFHWALFYKVFANSPTAFFLFRWFELLCVLGVWGAFIVEVTGKKWSAGLFATVALGFYKFYDGFFYLSICEPLGVLFTGLAAIFLLKALKPALDHDGPLGIKSAAISFLFLLLSVGTKETFFVVAAVFGFVTFLFSFKKKDITSFVIFASSLILFAILYILFIKFYIIRSYSAGYEMSNVGKLVGNLRSWVSQDLPWHAPWLVAAVLVMIFGGKSLAIKGSYRFALVLSVFLYLGYALILLPWSEGGHYSLPLGVFFALCITLAVVNKIENVGKILWSVIFIVILCFNVFVSSSALQWHRAYQTDTKNLVTWIAQNAIFEHEVQGGAVVRANATEPADTLPAMVKKIYGKEYKSFIFTSSVRQILADPDTKYFLWGTSWGDQDLRLLGPLWTPVFVSDNWVMFRRMY